MLRPPAAAPAALPARIVADPALDFGEAQAKAPVDVGALVADRAALDPLLEKRLRAVGAQVRMLVRSVVR